MAKTSDERELERIKRNRELQEQVAAARERMNRDPFVPMTDAQLEYAATARCRCGAGLAHPLDFAISMAIGAWVCSDVLKDNTNGAPALDQTRASYAKLDPVGAHDQLPWAFYKVREETSVNNTGSHTTRPDGTVARSISTACCPRCDHQWHSEPYDAASKVWPLAAGEKYTHRGHWLSGPCPACGYAVGGGASYNSADGERIERRGGTVILDGDGKIIGGRNHEALGGK